MIQGLVALLVLSVVILGSAILQSESRVRALEDRACPHVKDHCEFCARHL